jgi:hypothetical protein
MGAVGNFTVCATDLSGAGSSSPLTSHLRKLDCMKYTSHERLRPVAQIQPSLLGAFSVTNGAVQTAMQDAPGIRRLVLVAPAGYI